MFKIFFISFLLIYTRVFSQVTLTSSNNPAAGNIKFYIYIDTTGISPGNSGPNQTWNFTNIVRADSMVMQWILPSGTPNGSQYPGSDIASHDTCYNYFKNSFNKFEYLGTNSQTQNTIVRYSDFQTLMSYPFSYNSSFTDNFSGRFAVQGDSIYRTGTVNVTADAWGTINLPFGSFNNALRVKSIIITKDSSVNFNFVFNSTYTLYEWYVPNKKFYVFSIIYIELNVFDGSISFKNASYNPNSTPIGIQQISTEIPKAFRLHQNFPNPFNPATKIKFALPNGSFTNLNVYDALGREVSRLVSEELKPGTYEVDWNASNYPSGVYYYTLNAGGFTETRKMVLLR
jgi:hypothetical protein